MHYEKAHFLPPQVLIIYPDGKYSWNFLMQKLFQFIVCVGSVSNGLDLPPPSVSCSLHTFYLG